MSSDEQRTSKVSMEDSESNSEPQNLHKNGPSAWFTGTFRSNFKNVLAHLLNEEQSQEVNNSYTKTTLQSDKEQFCIQWCSQVNSSSENSPVPKCRMWCVRRVEDEATWNPFSGIHFYCIDGITNCQKQLEEMDTPQQPLTWNQYIFSLYCTKP
ncbi:hypothetical protein K7432_009439 [Basidiobolus ranarum]|uniref:Uncharacterized protein n=1 Tax=Basidiobolus ranarum TaxID=34480 RepID=A0ABR2WQ86_9FUNG